MSSAPAERGRVVAPDPDFDVRPFLDVLAAGVAGGANVVMQLSRPEVAYGVMESTWERGALTKHPFKRARTTGTYLAVAMLGTQRDIESFREAVNDAHRVVRSTAQSPVKYNAFDPELQLWVAACLFYGPYDYYCRVYGEPDPATAEAFYQHSARFATCLQVPRHRWPATLEDFWSYWDDAAARIAIDERTRAFLGGILSATFLPRPLARLVGRPVRFLNVGFLPAPFRDAMGITWSARDQQRHDRVLRWVGRIHRVTPGIVRHGPVYLNLWDLRIRRRLGLRLT